jgi:transcription antitermination factor NusA-like protein
VTCGHSSLASAATVEEHGKDVEETRSMTDPEVLQRIRKLELAELADKMVKVL